MLEDQLVPRLCWVVRALGCTTREKSLPAVPDCRQPRSKRAVTPAAHLVDYMWEYVNA